MFDEFVSPTFGSLRSNLVLLGGTAQANNYSREFNADDRRHVLEGCTKLIPSLKDAEIIKEQVAGY